MKFYEKKSPKHEPTDSYVYPEIQLANCMMRSDSLNLHVYKKELKKFLVDETLLKICSTDKDDSKGIILNKCSIEEDDSECLHKNINKQKDANNDT